jgi:hypothetical protein
MDMGSLKSLIKLAKIKADYPTTIIQPLIPEAVCAKIT